MIQMIPMLAMAGLGAMKNAEEKKAAESRMKAEMLTNAEMSRYAPIAGDRKVNVTDASAVPSAFEGALQGGMAGYQLGENMEDSAALRDSYATDKKIKEAKLMALQNGSKYGPFSEYNEG